MFEAHTLDILRQMGWRPVLIGLSVLVIAIVAGWGMAQDRGFGPVRMTGWWLGRMILPNLRRGWWGRTTFIFINNAGTCGLLIALGALRWGAWCGIVVVGLAMGMAVRLLAAGAVSPASADQSVDVWGGESAFTGPAALADDADCEQEGGDAAAAQATGRDDLGPGHAPRDSMVFIGVLLNLLEVPALLVTLGLSMGRHEALAGDLSAAVWRLFAVLVVPLLLAAAGGESLWLGRRPLS